MCVGVWEDRREEQPKRDLWSSFWLEQMTRWALPCGLTFPWSSAPHPTEKFPFCAYRCKLKDFPLGENPVRRGWHKGNPYGAGIGRFALSLCWSSYLHYFWWMHATEHCQGNHQVGRQLLAFHCCNRQVLTPGTTGRNEASPLPLKALEEANWAGNLLQAFWEGQVCIWTKAAD